MASGANWSFKWNGDELEKKVLETAGEALEECVQDIKTESQRICPKERGFNGGLVSTWYQIIEKAILSAKFGYRAPHAWLQHERTTYKHRNGEQAKYLQNPLDQLANRIMQRVGEALKRDVFR